MEGITWIQLAVVLLSIFSACLALFIYLIDKRSKELEYEKTLYTPFTFPTLMLRLHTRQNCLTKSKLFCQYIQIPSFLRQRTITKSHEVRVWITAFTVLQESGALGFIQRPPPSLLILFTGSISDPGTNEGFAVKDRVIGWFRFTNEFNQLSTIDATCLYNLSRAPRALCRLPQYLILGALRAALVVSNVEQTITQAISTLAQEEEMRVFIEDLQSAEGCAVAQILQYHKDQFNSALVKEWQKRVENGDEEDPGTGPPVGVRLHMTSVCTPHTLQGLRESGMAQRLILRLPSESYDDDDTASTISTETTSSFRSLFGGSSDDEDVLMCSSDRLFARKMDSQPAFTLAVLISSSRLSQPLLLDRLIHAHTLILLSSHMSLLPPEANVSEQRGNSSLRRTLKWKIAGNAKRRIEIVAVEKLTGRTFLRAMNIVKAMDLNLVRLPVVRDMSENMETGGKQRLVKWAYLFEGIWKCP